ncbi:MAG TPA: MFS transporter [Deltaproteobacteria bacterium]|nr:MFS transporter [Deltaproteobacteria bacterium]
MTDKEFKSIARNDDGERSLKLRLLTSSVVLYVIAVGFSAMFNLGSFDKLYIESNVSQYLVIGRDLQRRLESGIRYGKSLNQFIGIDKYLSEAKSDILNQVTQRQHTDTNRESALKDSDITVSVVAPDGTILYSDNKYLLNKKLPREAIDIQIRSSEKKKARGKHNYVKYQNTYIATLPVMDNQNARVGSVVISFEEKQIKAFLDNLYSDNLKPVIYISISGFLLLIGLLHVVIPSKIGTRSFSKKKFCLVIFTIIASVQILTSGLSTYKFKDHFLKANKANTLTTTRLLMRDIEHLLGQGVRLNRLFNMDKYIGTVINAAPELKDITLYDRNSQPLYRATKTRMTDFQNNKDCYDEWLAATKSEYNPDYHVKTDLIYQNQFRGYLAANTSKEILFKKIAEIGVDSLTVIAISILFFVELLILIFKYIERQVESGNGPVKVHYGVMRPAAFLFLFGIDISVSFLPLHMESLYVPILGLSRDTVMGLPISVEFLFVGISILISGVWLDRRGWHEPFMVGLILAGVGVLYSWLAPDALHFIISRGVVGLGYGLSLMASQGFVITFSDARSKAQGLAHLFAGIYAGSICGAATGGMLAERIGYSPVFLGGAIIMFSVIIYTLVFMRNAIKKPVYQTVKAKAADSVIKGKEIFNFLTNRTVLSLIFLSSLPAAIAVVGFLNYFSPIYLNRIGASQSTIGQLLMIYGICLIYFGPLISRYVDASKNKKLYIFLGCTLGSLAFLTFHILEGILAAAIAILLLGISSSFVLASQSAFALKLKVTQELGEGKAIGIFRSTSRVGQMLGPIIFSSIIVATNINQGITYLGIAYLLTALLFLFLTYKDRKTVVMEDA